MSDGNFGDTDAIIASLTPLQIKEFQKINQENKMKKKYTLTVLKDGIYQEVSPDEFDDFCEQCPEVADILKNPEKINDLPLPNLPDH